MTTDTPDPEPEIVVDPWTTRMIKETEAAEARIQPGDVFDPHDGVESDLNIFAADLLAEPDEGYDPTRNLR